jgi:hypothetical protein
MELEIKYRSEKQCRTLYTTNLNNIDDDNYNNNYYDDE